MASEEGNTCEVEDGQAFGIILVKDEEVVVRGSKRIFQTGDFTVHDEMKMLGNSGVMEVYGCTTM